MAPVLVDAGLQVTDAGVTIPGSTSDDSGAKVFTLKPDASYQPESTVELLTSPSIFDVAGSRIGAFYSHFETLGLQAGTAQAVSFSASAKSIDVRFSGAAPGSAPNLLADDAGVVTIWYSMHHRSWPSRWKRSVTIGSARSR